MTLPDLRFLSEGFARRTCRVHLSAARCRYLIVASVGNDIGFQCARLVRTVAMLLDARAEAGVLEARGDHCAGIEHRE
jgi:hypothetical protein